MAPDLTIYCSCMREVGSGPFSFQEIKDQFIIIRGVSTPIHYHEQ